MQLELERRFRNVWTRRARIWSPDGRFPLARRVNVELKNASPPTFTVSDAQRRFLDLFRPFLESYGYRMAIVEAPKGFASAWATQMPNAMTKDLRLGADELRVIRQLDRYLQRQGVMLRFFRHPPAKSMPLSHVLGKTKLRL